MNKNVTAGRTILHVSVSNDMHKRIRRERERLERVTPGNRVTASDAVRSLIERGLASSQVAPVEAKK
jgi:hypothetical protein